MYNKTKVDTKYHEFHTGKIRCFFHSFFSILLTFLLLLLYSNQLPPDQKFSLLILLIFFASRSVIYFLKITYDRPYIRITPDYIKIGKFDNLLWTDIICVKKILFFWSFEVRNISGYKLSILQQLALAIWHQENSVTPFFIDTHALSKKDLKKLKRLLKERVSTDFD